jgi:transcriptional regulator with XRE-family HTH domain
MATGIGDTLRAARRQQGRTLADAAAETRVRETYLAALEEEDFAAVGGDVYVKGFLRSYARYLGMDPAPLLERFRAEHERPEDQAQIAQQPLPPVGPVGPMGPMGERQGPSQAVIITAVVIGILLVLGLIGLINGGDDRRAAAPAPAPVETPTTQSLAPEPAADVPDPSAPALPAPDAASEGLGGAVVIQLDVTGGESYIRSDLGEPKVDGVYEAGFTQQFTSDAMVRLRIGNAGNVTLVANGRPLALGGAGDVVQVTCEAGASACEVRKIVPE